jgi:hypothetical protein
MVNISNKNLVSFLLNNSGYDFNDWGTIDEFPIKKVKYLGLKYDSDLVLSYIYGFITENLDLLLGGDQDYGKYTQPTLETYKIEGEERYAQATADLYYMFLESYSLEYLEVIKDGEVPPFKVETDYITKMDAIFDYGTFDRKDIIDTWDSESIIDRIILVEDSKEKKDGTVNESIIYETNIDKIDKMIKILTERKELLTKKRK